MRSKEIAQEGGYTQRAEMDGNILCSCTYSSLNPDAFIQGKTICKHIKEVLKKRNEARLKNR